MRAIFFPGIPLTTKHTLAMKALLSGCPASPHSLSRHYQLGTVFSKRQQLASKANKKVEAA